METVKICAGQLQPQLVSWRREFHSCPELKMDTPVTAGKIERILREIGITEIRTKVGGGGICAMIRGEKEGRCLGIRADCDGLPIREETGLPFASVNGNMHACGHDAHTAMALGAAKLLFENKENLAGSVKMIFQPYEEGGCGAKAMIADSVLENPQVDGMIALHTGNLMGSEYRSGDICYHPEISSFASAAFDVTFTGKSTHVCMPQCGADPVLPACMSVMQLRAVMEKKKEKDPSSQLIIAVPMIHGGERYNCTPDTCTIGGSIRTTSVAEQSAYLKRVQEICEAAASAMHCTAKMETKYAIPPTVNDAAMIGQFVKAAGKIVPPGKLKKMPRVAPIGEDFCFFAAEVPSVYFFHCSALEGERNQPHHSSRFDIDESTLASGSAILAQFALDWQKRQEEQK